MGDDTPELSRRQVMQISATSMVAVTAAGAAAVLAEAEAAPAMIPIERYILTRLSQNNCKTLFGVPGATSSPIFEAARPPSDVSLVVTANDLGAGYAADGYARMRGLGAVSVTYGVGMMSLMTAIAGAYVERSPVVIINGGPSAQDLRLQRDLGTLFSHSTGHPQSDLVMFREITEYAERAETAADVPRIVDRAIQVARTKQRPVYIEIAKDVWGGLCAAPAAPIDVTIAPSGNEAQIAKDLVASLKSATKPALLVGVYGGENALPSVTEVIERADSLLALGCVMGRQFRHLVQTSPKLTLAFNGAVKPPGKPAKPASLRALIAALEAQPWTPRPALIAATRLPGLSFDQRRASLAPRPAGAEPGLTYDEVLRATSDVLDATLLAITDTSLSMYPAAELNIAGRNGFMCNAVWQAIGYSVAAAVGAGIAQSRRPLVLCGDGGFQMTAQSLSTIVREKINAIVIVLDNGLHAIEQWLLAKSYFAHPGAAPSPYLALSRWNYAELATALGFGLARSVDTPDAFRQALNEARASAGPSFIAATLKPHSIPAGLPTS